MTVTERYHSRHVLGPQARTVGAPAHGDVLTPAEWAIVHAVRHGLSNARIAVRRG